MKSSTSIWDNLSVLNIHSGSESMSDWPQCFISSLTSLKKWVLSSVRDWYQHKMNVNLYAKQHSIHLEREGRKRGKERGKKRRKQILLIFYSSLYFRLAASPRNYSILVICVWKLRAPWFLSLAKESISQVFAIEHKIRDVALKNCAKQHLSKVHFSVMLVFI